MNDHVASKTTTSRFSGANSVAGMTTPKVMMLPGTASAQCNPEELHREPRRWIASTELR
jgi:hypothetical protein